MAISQSLNEVREASKNVDLTQEQRVNFENVLLKLATADVSSAALGNSNQVDAVSPAATGSTVEASSPASPCSPDAVVNNQENGVARINVYDSIAKPDVKFAKTSVDRGAASKSPVGKAVEVSSSSVSTADGVGVGAIGEILRDSAADKQEVIAVNICRKDMIAVTVEKPNFQYPGSKGYGENMEYRDLDGSEPTAEEIEKYHRDVTSRVAKWYAELVQHFPDCVLRQYIQLWAKEEVNFKGSVVPNLIEIHDSQMCKHTSKRMYKSYVCLSLDGTAPKASWDAHFCFEGQWIYENDGKSKTPAEMRMKAFRSACARALAELQVAITDVIPTFVGWPNFKYNPRYCPSRARRWKHGAKEVLGLPRDCYDHKEQIPYVAHFRYKRCVDEVEKRKVAHSYSILNEKDIVKEIADHRERVLYGSQTRDATDGEALKTILSICEEATDETFTCFPNCIRKSQDDPTKLFCLVCGDHAKKSLNGNPNVEVNKHLEGKKHKSAAGELISRLIKMSAPHVFGSEITLLPLCASTSPKLTKWECAICGKNDKLKLDFHQMKTHEGSEEHLANMDEHFKNFAGVLYKGDRRSMDIHAFREEACKQQVRGGIAMRS